MARSELYNVAAVAVVVDGISGDDFGDEFAFSVTFPDNLSSVTVGTNKASTSLGSNKTCTVEVSFKPTSPTNDQFFKLLQNQVNGQGRLFNVTANSGVNELLSFNNCSISSVEGLQGGGQEMNIRTFTLQVEEFKADQSLF